MSAKKSFVRKKLFVDPKLQGALVARVVLYWVVCLFAICLMLVCWQVVSGPIQPFAAHFAALRSHYGPGLFASLLLLPMVIVDILRLSNQFAGPVLRLRRSMRALTRGEPVEPIRFRDGDFWQEFADEFNLLAARVQSGAAASHAESEEEPAEVGG